MFESVSSSTALVAVTLLLLILSPLKAQETPHQNDQVPSPAVEQTDNSLSNDGDKVNAETTTPDDATGFDWIFSGNSSDGKRSVPGLDSKVKMFSTERACGFAIETNRGVLFPWMATLMCNNVQCTGTLVSNNLVVTSASCILACGTDPVRVLLGDSRLDGCGLKGVDVLAAAAVVNPKYSASKDGQFDIGLVQLLTPIDFNRNPFVYPICLVGVETDDPNIECEAVMGDTGRGPHQILNSPVNCYQPGNQLCASNGLTGITGCVRLQNCFAISSQVSVPVICRRKQNQRYYLWAVTTSTHAASGCISGVARVSDGFSFLIQGLGF